MSRAQVRMAIGYSSPNDTPDLLANTWRYRTSAGEAPVDLKFSEDGKLLGFTGNASALRTVQLQRHAEPPAREREASKESLSRQHWH